MSGESTVPGVATALLQLFPVASGGVLVTDGMGLTDAEATEVIQVGYVASDDESFAEGSANPEGGGGNRDREQYDVHCVIIVINGDGEAGDPAAARARAFTLLALLRRALITTQNLAPGVINASLTNFAYRPDKVGGGARAEIRFDVGVDAYTLP